jgi:hypothetical protein
MAAKRESKAQYIARRRWRVRELFYGEGLQPRAIAERLVREGTIETTDESLASALRLVYEDCAAVRAEVNDERAENSKPAVASNEIDALDRELEALRTEFDRQSLIADGQPTENCARSGITLIACDNATCEKTGTHKPFIGPAVGVTTTYTPQGPMISYRALWPAGVRQKASKDKAILAEKISKLERLLVEKRTAIAESQRAKKPGSGETAGDDIFRVVTSDKSTDELIAFNVSGGAEGPTN